MESRTEMPDLESQITELRNRIRDEGHAMDDYKAGTARAAGGAAFFGLLALGAAYELVAGKSGLWLTIGITHESLRSLASALGAIAAGLLVLAIRRYRRRDRDREAQLGELENELARLLDLQQDASKARQ
jgi:hypothetical protein